MGYILMFMDSNITLGVKEHGNVVQAGTDLIMLILKKQNCGERPMPIMKVT